MPTTMKQLAAISALFGGLITNGAVASANDPFVVNVWPGKPADDDAATIGDEKFRELIVTVRTPENTPPLLFVHASDDSISDVEHSVTMYVALKRAGVHSDLHIYSSGGHGFGVRPSNGTCSAWTQNCIVWLQSRGFLETNSKK
ncbi:MAG: prolyl oligopeptidase family serine peptidase [Planctomycetota bacterium]|nr:prolyl oligopeptidase family serine peptidase [Planctomycetota bacterium]